MTDTSKDAVDRLVLFRVRNGNTTVATIAHERDAANARADQARDKALLEAAERFPDGRQPWPPKAIRKAILALRDKPAPAVTVEDAARVLLTYLSEIQDSVVWETTEDAMAVPMADPGDVIFAALRAIAGGGDE